MGWARGRFPLRARENAAAQVDPRVVHGRTGAYVALTFGSSAGIGGGLWLIALRQGLSILRFGAHYALAGGQVELAQYLVLPPRAGRRQPHR